MNTSEPPVIQTEGLSKSCREVDALKNLDLHVPEESIFGFMGPNGAAKTTTIKLLPELIKPTGGVGAPSLAGTPCATASPSEPASVARPSTRGSATT